MELSRDKILPEFTWFYLVLVPNKIEKIIELYYVKINKRTIKRDINDLMTLKLILKAGNFYKSNIEILKMFMAVKFEKESLFLKFFFYIFYFYSRCDY